MSEFTERFKRGWNAFVGRDQVYSGGGMGYSSRPDRVQLRTYNARSVMGSIFNRIAVDISMIEFSHVRLDDDGNLLNVIKDPLNSILNSSANIDQTSMAFFKDASMKMFNTGVVALAVIDSTSDPKLSDSYKIGSVRAGEIKEWRPTSVLVELYDDKRGVKRDLWCPKSSTAIIENPFYEIMNEPNSLLQRLVRLLNQIDRTNEQNSSGKLDLILQLPYVIKSPARRAEAERRRRDIEDQLKSGPYGIAYTDGTERITQLNRAVENNLWSQAKDLEEQLYNQLGLTKSIFDGTADEQTSLNYHNRTIEPIARAFAVEMQRKWLSPTAISQRQAIWFHRDPFKLVPVGQMADIADKFTRNEILTSNEIRSIVGKKPSKDPKADQLINSNINHPDEGAGGTTVDGSSIAQLSTKSQSMLDSTKIQNAQRWLNQIGTQTVSTADGGTVNE